MKLRKLFKKKLKLDKNKEEHLSFNHILQNHYFIIIENLILEHICLSQLIMVF
jgi:hypothetical protein